MVLILKFPERNDIEHLLICLFAICISSLARYLFTSFTQYLIVLFIRFCCFKTSLYIFVFEFFIVYLFSKYFLSLCHLSIYSPNCVLCRVEFFLIVMKFNLSNILFSFMDRTFNVVSKNSLPN